MLFQSLVPQSHVRAESRLVKQIKRDAVRRPVCALFRQAGLPQFRNLYELVAVSLIGLVIFGVFSGVFNSIFAAITRVNLWKEVYEENNTGAAIGQAALYAGISNVIVHFMK